MHSCAQAGADIGIAAKSADVAVVVAFAVPQAASAYYAYKNGLGNTPRLPEYSTIVSQQSYPAKVIEFYPQVVKYAPPAK